LGNTYHFFRRFGIDIKPGQSLILFGIVLAVLFGAFWRFRKKGVDDENLFLFGFLLLLLSELFIQAPRAGYNLILWIFPLSLIYLRERRNYSLMTILGVALLLFHDFPFNFRYQGELAEFTFLLILIYSIFGRTSRDTNPLLSTGNSLQPTRHMKT
jgi:hypothetical protein